MLRRVAIALLLALAAPAAAAPVPVDLELILAIDVSGSVDLDEARLQREGYVAAFRHPDVIRAIESGQFGQIAVLYTEWAGRLENRVVLDWRLVRDRESAEAFAEALAAAPISRGRRTSISAAIDFAVPRFGTADFEGLRRVIDLSGDGPNNDGGEVVPARDRAIEAGIVINGLPIINERQYTWGLPNLKELDAYYRDCVVGGPGAFHIVAEDFHSFASAIRRKLVLEIAGRSPVSYAHSHDRPEIPMVGPDGKADCLIGEKLLDLYLRRREIAPY